MMETIKRHRSPEDPTDPFYDDGTVDYSRVQGNNPTAGGEYPKLLYRAGGNEEIHGHKVETALVGSDDQEEAYREEGWRETPAKAAAFGAKLVADPPKPDPRDKELARLREELAAARQKRGPGRPPKVDAEPEPLATE